MIEEPENVEETEEGDAASEPTRSSGEDQEATASDASSSEAASPSADEPQSAPSDEEAEAPEEAALEPDVAPAVEAAAEALSPKERRRRARAEKAAAQPTRPQRSPEERQQERREERARKAAARRTGRERARAKRRAAASDGAQTTPPREHQPGAQKTRQGVVVSDAPDKTITVRIDVARRHREYKKIVRTSSTLHVHDERNDAHVGDTVVVRECRPLSRTKHWRLVEVVERAR